MTETHQHQQPLQHAIDVADHAILQAQDAEHQLQVAISQANPRSIQSANAALTEAKQQVYEAHEQLRAFNNDEYGQQIQQTMEQLTQASQDLEANQEKFHTPKQIR
ncbi:hypothetical protein M5X11_10805 [Paenibacillus alginolyticus]|jgi:cellobiose-specific phosphotransferase system component IIA|uniref:Uncharacterized protein n=1 Tax=Paenibacillus alginolyticus TaxID=59839 RepID=A0ABT4GQ63_9BACL|nr:MULTISPECIES: hypothetical protein [Paenibacillus]MCY9665447.1 hypothetical protein [Paenibacillus alginolyticus]MCY9698375.1 hypothetical protein [Paenibacillus alginolyticus]MEC0148942.1 hypothetical protein [Paenibacillus alginolyticus]NRF92920.1 hypothetical protein [Paenibacillus frigoriresistens]